MKPPLSDVSQAARKASDRWATEIGKYGGVFLDTSQRLGLAMAFAAFERDHLATVAPQPVDVEAMRGALEKARDQFAFYAREHSAAGKTEKAATNQQFADMLTAALTTPPIKQSTNCESSPEPIEEIIDGAFGDGPFRRGLARDLNAKTAQAPKQSTSDLEGRAIAISAKLALDLDRRRVMALARLLLMLSIMAGDGPEILGFDAAELYAEVSMALGIEDRPDIDGVAGEIMERCPNAYILAHRLTALSQREAVVEEAHVFLDCDGVLADFDTYAEVYFGMNPRAYEAKVGSARFWQELEDKGDFYRNLPLMPDAMKLYEGVKHLHPTILTGCPRGNWAQGQKVAWAAEHFPGVPIITCRSADKRDYAKPGDVLIDDWPQHRHRWIEMGGVFITHHDAETSLAALWAHYPSIRSLSGETA